jgi:hypothetical protein
MMKALRIHRKMMMTMISKEMVRIDLPRPITAAAEAAAVEAAARKENFRVKRRMHYTEGKGGNHRHIIVLVMTRRHSRRAGPRNLQIRRNVFISKSR